MRRISQCEYIDAYVKESGCSAGFLSKLYTCLPCTCGQPHCVGWTFVSRNPESIEYHKKNFMLKRWLEEAENTEEDDDIEGLDDDDFDLDDELDDDDDDMGDLE